MKDARVARFYRIRGRVQGVGFRYFAEKAAHELGIRGWVRNDDDGTVQVYAVGTREQLSEMAGLLWKGPRWAEVRGVEESEAAIEKCSDFSVRQ
ncbi:MAG TPA: acylphosphatase [Bryobacteraceae bacterium]